MWLVESVYITLYVSLWADVVAHSGYPTFLLQENKMISRDRVLRSLKIIRMSRFWDNLMILREINILQKNKVGCPKLATLVQCFLSHNFLSYFPKRFDYLVHNPKITWIKAQNASIAFVAGFCPTVNFDSPLTYYTHPLPLPDVFQVTRSYTLYPAWSDHS